ncbi:MAG: hypothetical protein IKW30_10985 [Lachnospiraceae bacterium]|nr:hypothetical protein [Lachnospiraceae bacterium]
MTKADYKPVYRMDFAMALRELGHRLHFTMPNPKNNKYNIFIFEKDETLEADLEALISNDCRKGV